jgi:hypothetical protein
MRGTYFPVHNKFFQLSGEIDIWAELLRCLNSVNRLNLGFVLLLH